MKLKRAFSYAYLVIGALAALEFIFVRGMFTWLIAVAAVCAVGAVNAVLAARAREWEKALLYVLCTTALCMGYFVLAA